MKLTLHHCHETRSMRPLWLLNELGVPFDLVIHPFGRELRNPDYLQLNPAGRVPCLVMEDQAIIESGAIIEVLCDAFPESDLGRAPGHPERAKWLQWLHYAETVAVHDAALTQQHIVINSEQDRSPLILKLERLRLIKTLEVLDIQLTQSEFLLPGGFSAADIAIGYSVFVASHFVDLRDLSILHDYYGRLVAREAYQRSVARKCAG